MTPAPLRVVVTGPESTGKTTLALRLGAAFGAPVVPEFLRGFVEARLPSLRAGEPLVEPEHSAEIVRSQIAAEEAAAAEAAARGAACVVCDTDPLTTLVYHEHYFGERPAWLVDLVATRRYALSLLQGVDVPWVGDPLRDQPTGRAPMFERFREELRRSGRPFVEISGDWPQRDARALSAVRGLLGERA